MKRYIVVILNGTAKSGKDSFVVFFRNTAIKGRTHKKQVVLFSTIDPIKKIMKTGLNWDGTKTEKSRKMMHELKKLTSWYNDLSYKETIGNINRVIRKVENPVKNNQAVIFIMCREPEDIARYKKYYKNNAVSLLIRRPEAEKNIPDNEADKGVFQYDYDYYIENNTDLNAFQEKAEKFYHELKNRLTSAD